ncbi:MAG: glycosyltransferase family 2 protein [Hyphomicrobiaceae bacterium]|nr:glycosyltransferase family 2 protein [Hyphomicrobiaceae bacterium]
MPCLNEAETIVTCIEKARGFLERAGIDGEVIIADNGSTDGSQDLALDAGARVVDVAEKGYGAALSGGIAAAYGKFIIMGDADDSYDFSRLDAFVERLRDGDDLVMGNRFEGGIAPGAMPPLHRYFGNPVLSFVGRLFFGSKIGDFHCGLRGFNRASIQNLGLRTTGMEFASEMVVKATLTGLRISEVATTLSKDGRSRAPHLRSFRDGWRHLRFLLLFSPRWLFLYPGITLLLIGIFATGALLPGPVQLTARIELDIHTLLIASMFVLVGVQAISFALIGRRFASRYGFIPPSQSFDRILEALSLERILLFSAIIIFAGIAGIGWSINRWADTGFGRLAYGDMMRWMIISITAIVAGMQTIMTGFLSSMINIPLYERRVTDIAHPAHQRRAADQVPE